VKSVLTAFAFALLIHAQNAAPGAPSGSGSSFSGRVVNSVTHGGISGAHIIACPVIALPPSAIAAPYVIVLPAPPAPCRTAVADDAGAFSLAGIADGKYSILPDADGFALPTRCCQPLNVSGDTRTDFEMTPNVGVHGRVLDPEGRPAAGIVVALDMPGCNGCTAWDVKVTGETGEFLFEDVPSNRPMLLSAFPKTPPEVKVEDAKAEDSKTDEKIVTTYYPSVTDRGQADVFQGQGVDLFGFDIKLRTAPARKVRGAVLDADGKPLPNALVSIVKPASGMIAMVLGVPSGDPADIPVAEPTEALSDGTFAFPAVVEGNWTIRAVVKGPGPFAVRSGSAEVGVSRSDVEDLVIRAAPPFEVPIAADWGASPPAFLPNRPAPPLAMFVSLDSPRLPTLFAPGQPAPVQLFGGRYLIGPNNVPPGHYLAAAMLDNRDVLGQVVELLPGASIKLIYKTDGGSVQGTVEKGADATVVLMADAMATARLGYSARCDANGAFVVRDVPPGEYTAVAVSGGVGDPLRPEFQTMLTASGKRIRVEAGASVEADLRLTRPQ
jgi:hypothetical protein